MDDYVFPCEELSWVIKQLVKAFQEPDCFVNKDLYERMHAVARHAGQVHAMVGADASDWRGLRVPRRVNDAALAVYRYEGGTLFFGAECWKGGVFRAAVRANADLAWAEGFIPALDAAWALGGQRAVLDYLVAEFPPLSTPEDRRRAYEEERARQEHLLFERALAAQEEAA